MFATEAIVRLQRGRFASGPVPLTLKRLKIGLYALILAIAAYWGSKSQVLYLWDEIVWVLGFLVIDRNIRDWQTFQRPLSASPSAA